MKRIALTAALLATAAFAPTLIQTKATEPQADKSLGVVASFALIVNDVQEGTPAAEANLTSGDFILEVDGKQFFSLGEFQSLVRASDKPLKLRVLRFNDSGRPEVFEVQTKRP